MVSLRDIPFQVEVTNEEKSFFIDVGLKACDVNLEARGASGVVVNAVTTDGETIFLAQGDVVRINERLTDCASVEVVSEGNFAYRAHVSEVRETEVLDPRPATVVERLTQADQVAILVKEEISRRLSLLEEKLRGVEGLEVDDIMEDIKSGDMEFEEDEEEFVSTSYEDLAEEPVRYDQKSGEAVSATSGGQGAGNEAPSLNHEENTPQENAP